MINTDTWMNHSGPVKTPSVAFTLSVKLGTFLASLWTCADKRRVHRTHPR